MFDNYKEPTDKILEFYSPFINKYLELASPNEITFYAKILAANDENKKASEIIKYGLKKYPFCSALLFSLSEYYLQNKDLDNALGIIKKVNDYFPNDPIAISKFYKYYELKNDYLNKANYAYLLGLRNHDPINYQEAVQIYLDLSQLPKAKLALKKLIRLNGETPLTLLYSSRYLDLSGPGHRQKVYELLNKAYALSKTQGQIENKQITKSIIASLINMNLFVGNMTEAKKYLTELEALKELSAEDRALIQILKSKLSTRG